MMILVTGGSGSGKSAFAEDCVLSFGEAERVYVATMFPFDDESKKRVKRHREMRKNKNFDTVECYTGLEEAEIPADSVVLLECMSNLVANEMFQPEGAGRETVDAVKRGVKQILKVSRHLVIVTNEIFSDGARYEGEMAEYCRSLGRINQALAEFADQVVEVVYGIPVYHKGGAQ